MADPRFPETPYYSTPPEEGGTYVPHYVTSASAILGEVLGAADVEPVIMDRGLNMTSYSMRKQMSATDDGEVVEVYQWTLMTVKLDSTADGDNYVGFTTGSDMLHVEPGEIVGPHLIAPNTTVYVSTTASAEPVTFSFLFTEVPLLQLMEGLITQAEVIATLGKELLRKEEGPEISKRGPERMARSRTRRQVIYGRR